MLYPLNSNTIEQLEIDPDKKINGYIWFNKVEKVYKTWVDGKLHVFLTDNSLEFSVGAEIESILNHHQFTVSFSKVFELIIKHDKQTTNFNYNVYDDIEKCNLPCGVEILNENEIKIEFVEAVTGYIFMQFG